MGKIDGSIDRSVGRWLRTKLEVESGNNIYLFLDILSSVLPYGEHGCWDEGNFRLSRAPRPPNRVSTCVASRSVTALLRPHNHTCTCPT